MAIRYQTIGFAEQCDLAGPGDDDLVLVRASGRGVQLDIPHGWLSVWLPLAGTLHLESTDSQWEIGARQLHIWRAGRLRCSTVLPCWWIGLAGPMPAWSQALNAVSPRSDLDIFSWEGHAPHELRRLLVRLLRCADPARAPTDAQPLLEALCAEIIEQQHELHERVDRCSGRTLRRRQQTLSRLLRVQHMIRNGSEERPDLARLARSANYSPCHLIRLYREVFDETPSEYAARLRHERAWQLVRDTSMPVCEITEALGFESQSAFCRAFKSTFGITTGEARRAHTAVEDICEKAA